MATQQKPKEGCNANKSHDHAYWQLDRRNHGSRQRVGEEKQGPASQDGHGHEYPLVVAHHQPRCVGHDQADEPDRACGRDRQRGRDGRGHVKAQAQRADIDTQRLRGQSAAWSTH